MVAKRALYLAVFATLLMQVLGQQCGKSSEPRVGCPSGHYKAWNYFRPGGWGNICPFYGKCSTGRQQSPINIPAFNTGTNLPATLRFSLQNTRVHFVRVGNYLSFPVSTTNTMRWGNQDYFVKRLEFHSPSEHTIQGRHSNLEVQIYLESLYREQVAVALLYNVGSCDDPFFSRVIPALPRNFKCECGNNRTEFWPPFNEACDQGHSNAMLPDRCRPNCVLPRCGDTVTDTGEQCDDGLATVLPNRCRPNCTLPKCGDGVFDNATEQCDDGNPANGDGCSANCTIECGDGCLNLVETCDNGLANSDAQNATGVCRKNCLPQRCGDGIIDFPEECDTGNYANRTSVGGSLRPNDCRPNCTLPKCGDGVVDPAYGEECEPNPALNPANDTCSPTCKLYCGNGIVEPNRGEACDNGTIWNLNEPGFYCRPDCQVTRCGDGVVDGEEECDERGVESARCFRNCRFKCGNGVLDVGEVCDNGDPSLRPLDGNSKTRANACRLNCVQYSCGDGTIDPLGGEQCDDGLRNNNSLPNACRANCTLPSCGDGVVDAGEQCDDANRIDQDGCSCCRRDCGDGVRQPGEDCDDGAANSDTVRDRCRLNCKRHFCGDGIVDSDEECDPKNSIYPGCTAQCKLPFCGDGIVQSEVGEECDRGVNNSYNDVDGCSPICTLNRCGQVITDAQVNLKDLIPSQTVRAFCYRGSETKPPCAEGLQWFVVPTARLISPNQFAAFNGLISKSNRPVQPLNGRNPLVCTPAVVGLDARACSVCGNGIVEPGEQCDRGTRNHNTAPDACRTNCMAARCGDGVKDTAEECDGESYCSPVCRIIRRNYAPVLPQGSCVTLERQGLWSNCSSTCSSGMMQSPIRLPTYCPLNRPFNLNHPANIQYNPTPVILFNTGSQMMFPVIAGGTFNWKGTTYVLTHIEFHEPSEHWIGNQQYPFEVQLFHTAQNTAVSRVAVLSVLFNIGTDRNDFLRQVFDRLPSVSDCKCGNGIKEDAQMLPDGRIVREQCDCGSSNSDSLPNKCRTDCRNPYCGDGVIDSGEFCDQGARNSRLPNLCRPTCTLPSCGDGVVDDSLNEQCDDGNNRDGDGCSKDCKRECGNGVVEGNEVCDDGQFNSDTRCDACRSTCRRASCGDNTVDSAEQCDNGASNSDSTPNACRTRCVLPTCGDGVVDSMYGEECDGGYRCGANCLFLCGNGRIDPGEECDNGKLNSDLLPNSCRTNCKLAYCGDSIRDSGEECDAGSVNTPACENCRIRCGNGVLDSEMEQCDDGLANNDTLPNSCRTNCRSFYCGDGVLDMLEQCDNGALNANTSDACRPWCSLPMCGDGIVDVGRGEQCDGTEGCGPDCKFLCGNGRLDPLELCDDGPRNSDHNAACCRSTCTFPRCGDGVTDPNEECDDGPFNSNGPNSCRSDCTRPTCGDGIVDYLYGEACDQGARNSLTAVDGCSPKCTLNLCRQSVNFNVQVNPRDLLPTAPGAYRYQGSLKTPPCTENVDYFVFSSPSTLSACQLGKFRRVLSGNARCLQPRNNRPVDFLEEIAKCGDGIVEGNEECDNGARNSDFRPDACRRNCRKARCGDGVLDSNEICDGTPNCSPSCSLDCSVPVAGTVAAPTLINGEDDTTINVNFANVIAQ